LLLPTNNILTHFSEFQNIKGYPERKMYIGSMEGQVIKATWEGCEFNSGENIIVEGK
jgi:hypothetical protein